ncbi:hypothetical protein QJQ45_012774 [Haematococcus lacustris]|nr:hypothetical protein QJQ45_012774 [Haematococcus lacustris]
MAPHLLNRQLSTEIRTSLTRFRLGNSGLGVEKARFEGLTLIDRTCTRCTEGVVDDAMHFIFECTATSSIREQPEFAMTLQNNNENLHDFMLSLCAAGLARYNLSRIKVHIEEAKDLIMYALVSLELGRGSWLLASLELGRGSWRLVSLELGRGSWRLVSLELGRGSWLLASLELGRGSWRLVSLELGRGSWRLVSLKLGRGSWLLASLELGRGSWRLVSLELGRGSWRLVSLELGRGSWRLLAAMSKLFNERVAYGETGALYATGLLDPRYRGRHTKLTHSQVMMADMCIAELASADGQAQVKKAQDDAMDLLAQGERLHQQLSDAVAGYQLLQADMEQVQAARQELQGENEALDQQAEEHNHAIQLLQRDKRQLSHELRNVRHCRPIAPRLPQHQQQLLNILMRHRVSPEVLQRCAEGGYGRLDTHGNPTGCAFQQPSPAANPPALTANFIPTQVGRHGKPAARTAAYLAQHYLSTARLVLQTQASSRELAMCRELFVNEQCQVPNPHRPGQSTTVRRQLRVVAKYLKSKTLEMLKQASAIHLAFDGCTTKRHGKVLVVKVTAHPPPQPPPQQPPQQQGKGPPASPDFGHMYQLALAAIATEGQAAMTQAPAPGCTLRKRTTLAGLGQPQTAAKRKR